MNNTDAQNKQLKPGAIAAGALLLGALFVHLFAPVSAWRWSHQPNIGALLEHTLVVSSVEARRAGATVGLRYGDRITAVDGIPVVNRRDLDSVLGLLPIGEQVTLTVETLQGSSRVGQGVTVSLAGFPASDLIAFFVVPYVIGLCYLGIGTWVFVQQYAQARVQLFAVFCAGASVLISGSFDILTTHNLTRVWTSAWPLTGAALLCMGLTCWAKSTLSPGAEV